MTYCETKNIGGYIQEQIGGKTNLDLLVATVDKTNFKVEVVITTEVSSMSL